MIGLSCQEMGAAGGIKQSPLLGEVVPYCRQRRTGKLRLWLMDTTVAADEAPLGSMFYPAQGLIAERGFPNNNNNVRKY